MFLYNSTKEQLRLAEYGRNLQNIVNYIVSIEDREKRNVYAHAIADWMCQISPQTREIGDYKHKIWDHLHVISGYKLDVDSPYPVPTPESFKQTPNRLSYPNDKIRVRHYGKSVEKLLEKVKTIQEQEVRNRYVADMANFMKLAYVNWNKDYVSDEVILADLKMLSKGELQLGEETSLNQVQARNNNQQRNNKNKNRNKNNNNNNNNGKKNWNKNRNKNRGQQ